MSNPKKHQLLENLVNEKAKYDEKAEQSKSELREKISQETDKTKVKDYKRRIQNIEKVQRDYQRAIDKMKS